MPLAIDLFCGLFQPKFFWSGDSLVQHLVACRAKNPNHVPLAVRHQAPSALTLKSWAVGYLDNTAFPASLACTREIWIFAPKARCNRIPVWAARIVNLLNAWVFSVKRTTLDLCRFCGAAIGAVSLIAVRLHDVEMFSANTAITPSLCDVGLLSPTQTPLPRLTLGRAISFIRPLGLER